MIICFNDIHDGLYKAAVTDIEERINSRGNYSLCFYFSITEGNFIGRTFSALLKPSASKNSKFFAWISNILGFEPQALDTSELIGKKCLISIARYNNNYFKVISVLNTNQNLTLF